MTAWLLSIVGVVALGVLLDIILDDGETTKYIRGVFAIAVVLVIVAPLPKLFSKDISIEQVLGSEEYSYDREFVEHIAGEYEQDSESRLSKYLESKGVQVQSVSIHYDSRHNVDFVRCHIVGGGDLQVQCRDWIADWLSVDKEVVRVYGQ